MWDADAQLLIRYWNNLYYTTKTTTKWTIYKPQATNLDLFWLYGALALICDCALHAGWGYAVARQRANASSSNSS